MEWLRLIEAWLALLAGLGMPLVSAQNVQLLPTAASSSFPACALSCAVLTQAQSLCVPPSAPVTDQATYVNCFCQSALLTTLHASPDSLCTSDCTVESDRQLLQQWYSNYCASGGNAATTAKSSTTVSSTATATATAAAQATVGAQVTTSSPPGWFAGHWQWVLMIIILALGFGTLAALGIWLKRRHSSSRGKATSPGMFSVPAADSVSAINNEMWGPPQATANIIAPVEDPPQMVSTSRTASSSTNTLVSPTPRAMTRSTTKLRNDTDSSTQEETEQIDGAKSPP